MMLRRIPTRLGTEQNEICELDEIRKKMRVKYEMEGVPTTGDGSTTLSDGKITKGTTSAEVLPSSGPLHPATRHQRLGLTRGTSGAAGIGSVEHSGHGLRE